MSFFSREELLHTGLPVRRASMMLFAIENRTAQLAEQDTRDAAVYLTYANAQTSEQDFFAALARSRAGEVTVTIQQIERYARQWSTLLPRTSDAALNAALADLIGKKYKFTPAAIPNLRAVLQFDDPKVRQAFSSAFHRPLDTIYAPRTDPVGRLRFAWGRSAARLENIPPFWLAFFLTMPGAAGLLALPIAMVRVGLVGGLLLLFAFALLNMFTVAALAEATARAGVTRLGLGWLGQLVQEYLGRAGSAFLTVILALNNFFVLAIFYLGVGGTLQDATRLPIALWILVLFGICVFFLSRGSLNSTIASTLVIVLIVLLLLLLIPLLALPHFQVENLARSAFIAVDFASIQFTLAILLTTFFSHLLVATYAPVVIRRDASARNWIRGSAAAIFGFFLIASFWLVLLNGALSPETIASAPGTILAPLAERAGSIVLWLGSLLVILSLGLATVQISLGLYYMVQERLPVAHAGSFFSTPRARFGISILPMFGVLALAEWLAFTGAGSFSQLLGILSAFSLPLLSGIFPILLFAATRRKGEFVPARSARLFGHPVLLGAVYFLFIGFIFTYGIFVFQDILARVLIIAVGIATLAVTFVILQRGMIASRLVVLVQKDERDARASTVAVIENGQAADADLVLENGHGTSRQHTSASEIVWDGLRAIQVRLNGSNSRSVKLWALHFTNDGTPRGIKARVEIKNGEHSKQLEWNQARAETNLMLEPGMFEAQLVFDERTVI